MCDASFKKINPRNFYASRALPNKEKQLLLRLSSVSLEIQMVPKLFEITCGFCLGENSGSKVFLYTQWINLLLMKSSALKINNLATLEVLLPFHSQGCYWNKTRVQPCPLGQGRNLTSTSPPKVWTHIAKEVFSTYSSRFPTGRKFH